MAISLNSLFGSLSGKGGGNATFVEKLKWVGVSLILLFALLVIDYFFNQSDEQFAESDLLPELPVEIQLKQSSESESEIIALYNQFDLPEVVEADKEDESTEEVIDSMSLAEQNQQSGLLSKLYIDDAIYRLSGIVSAGEYRTENDKPGESRAALSVSYTQQPVDSISTVKENDSEVSAQDGENVSPLIRKTNISLSKGDNLGPYRVESIDSRRLVLVDNGRRLWLELFVPQMINNQDDQQLIDENG
ncbi:hypothetical protein [Shewanella psychrotolerans]|uniref:hypothetical protein n=1 Tax=Shewanella psychrotolerans TaxID=2864206 RepID=UPI001C655BC3|nr:hypothetical protein [Shewanella psychrotolerans]QYK00280.1 hypothetical protein K0I62_12775 [Shewanella psychrotolerans]